MRNEAQEAVGPLSLLNQEERSRRREAARVACHRQRLEAVWFRSDVEPNGGVVLGDRLYVEDWVVDGSICSTDHRALLRAFADPVSVQPLQAAQLLVGRALRAGDLRIEANGVNFGVPLEDRLDEGVELVARHAIRAREERVHRVQRVFGRSERLLQSEGTLFCLKLNAAAGDLLLELGREAPQPEGGQEPAGEGDPGEVR